MKEGWGTWQGGRQDTPHFPSPETSEENLFQGLCFLMLGVICPSLKRDPWVAGCAD